MDRVSLQDFVAQTLISISLGVAAAQDASKKGKGIPIALGSVGEKDVQHGEQLVKFSIALQAENKAAAAGSASIAGTIVSVISGKLDVSASKESKQESLHSVGFSVPIHFNSRWREESIKA